MLIPLTCGLFAEIDDADYLLVSGRKWQATKSRKTFYARSGTGKSAVIMHRVILGAPKDIEVDHKDRNGLNNKRSNLRLATRSQNVANGSRAVGKCGFRGVDAAGKNRDFQAAVRVNGKNISLGYYKSALAAAQAYDKGARKHHGEFAVLNFPETEKRAG